MRIIKIDMTNKTITEEEFRQEDWGYLGGRGLIDEMVTKNLDPMCDPLGPDNVLSFATGLFCGTIMTTSGRLSIGGKSPLTGGIKESNAGGTFSRWMNEQQIKMITVEGKPADGKQYYLYVSKDGKLSLEDASFISMKMTYDTCETLRKKYSDDISIACIGPAGERGSLVSSILVTEFDSHCPCRAAARGGLGAVMGSKGLKAIVIDKAEKPYKTQIPSETAAEFKEACKVVTNAITTNPMTGDLQRKCGSAAGVGATGKMGALPWKNFSGKICPEYEKLAPAGWMAALTGQGGHGTIPCQPGCVVCCSNEFHDKDGNYLSAGIEYETLVFMGTNLGIFNPNFVASGDRFCDDYGVDTIDIGCAIAVAMDCGICEFGDEEAAMKLLKSIQDPDDELGRVILNGCQATGEHLHAKRIPTGKRQALAAYDPRVLKGFGMTFERSPMGADHTAAAAKTSRTDLIPEDQVDMNQANSACCDDFGVCLFAWGSVAFEPTARDAIARAAGALCGKSGVGQEIIEDLGRKMLYIEHTFNKGAGFTIEDDRIGDFFYTEPAEVTGKPYESPLTRSFLEIADERAAEKK